MNQQVVMNQQVAVNQADVSAALIRPDGHVAWATEEADPGKLAAVTREALDRAALTGADR